MTDHETEPVNDERHDAPVSDTTDRGTGVADFETQLEELRAERDDYLAQAQRLQAEFANYRRQTTQRNETVAANAQAGLAEALLPVLDACDAAVEQGITSVQPIADQLRAELVKAGLEHINTEGVEFDPNVHDAISHEPGPGTEEGASTGTVRVVRIVRTGYTFAGRTIRAASVTVQH